VGDVD